MRAILGILPPDVISSNLNDLFVEAVKAGQKKVAAVFVDFGADINLRNVEGLTLLMKAAAAGKAHQAVMLVELGAETDATDNRHRTALMIATINGRVDVVRGLRRIGIEN